MFTPRSRANSKADQLSKDEEHKEEEVLASSSAPVLGQSAPPPASVVVNEVGLLKGQQFVASGKSLADLVKDKVDLPNNTYLLIKSETDAKWNMVYITVEQGVKTFKEKDPAQFLGLVEALPAKAEDLNKERIQVVDAVIQRQKRENDLKELFREFVETEKSFHERLGVFIDTVDATKKTAETENFLLPYRQFKANLFGELEQTLEASKALPLDEQVKAFSAVLAKVMGSAQFAEGMKGYERAIVEQEACMRSFARLPIKFPKSADGGATTAQSYLIEAVQRTVRYNDLIKGMVGNIKKLFPESGLEAVLEGERDKIAKATAETNHIINVEKIAQRKHEDEKNLNTVMRACGKVADSLAAADEVAEHLEDPIAQERYARFHTEMHEVLAKVRKPEDDYEVILLNVDPDAVLVDEDLKRIYNHNSSRPLIIKQDDQYLIFGNNKGVQLTQTELNPALFKGLPFPPVINAATLKDPDALIINKHKVMVSKAEITPTMYTALRQGHLPKDIQPIQVGASFAGPFITAYVDAYLHHKNDKNLLEVMRKFIRDADGGIATIKVGHDRSSLSGIMFSQRNPLDPHAKDQALDNSVFSLVTSMQREDLVRHVFNEVKGLMGQATTPENKNVFAAAVDIIIKMAERDGKSELRLDSGALKTWNDLCSQHFLELKISAVQQEQERLKAAYEDVIKNSKTEDIILEQAEKLFPEVRQGYAALKKNTPPYVVQVEQAFNQLVENAKRGSLNNEQLRVHYQSLIHNLYLNAYLDDRTRGRKGLKWGTIKGPYLKELEKFIVAIETDLIGRGQKGLLVDNMIELQGLVADPKKEQPIFKSLLANPESLRSSLRQLCSRVEEILTASNRQMAEIEKNRLEMQARVKAAEEDLAKLQKNDPQYKQKKNQYEGLIKSGNHALSEMKTVVKNLNEELSKALMNPYKVLERMEVDKVNQPVKAQWSQITSESPFKTQFAEIHQIINVKQEIEETPAQNALISSLNKAGFFGASQSSAAAALQLKEKELSGSLSSTEKEVSRSRSPSLKNSSGSDDSE